MVFKSIMLAAVSLIFSGSVSAAVYNTLNGVNYEWLELTATQGLSRDAVSQRLSDPGDVLYGYEYASRALVRDLLLSYAPWDGNDGLHGSPAVVAGLQQYINDFGALFTSTNFGLVTYTSVDGYGSVTVDDYVLTLGMMGTDAECGNWDPVDSRSCLANVEVYYSAGLPSLAYQAANLGYDSESSFIGQYNSISDPNVGSYLVKVSAVPVPAAVWLFGSGTLALTGFARQKKRKQV